MFIRLLLLCLAPQEPVSPAQVYDLRTLFSPAVLSINQTLTVREERSRLKIIPSGDGKERREKSSTTQHFTEQVLQVEEDGSAGALLRHFTKAQTIRDGKTKILAHQGKNVLYQLNENGAWSFSVYELKRGERHDVEVPAAPLQHIEDRFISSNHNLELILARLPPDGLTLGQAWLVSTQLLAEAYENLEGMNVEKSYLTLRLLAVSDTQVELSVSGQITLNGEANIGNKDRMTWVGKVTGNLTLARNGYLELNRKLHIDEVVTVTVNGQSITGRGTTDITRKMKLATSSK